MRAVPLSEVRCGSAGGAHLCHISDSRSERWETFVSLVRERDRNSKGPFGSASVLPAG